MQNPTKVIKTMVILISWELWCERNARIFRNKGQPPLNILAKIKEEAATWVTARATNLRELTALGEIP